MMEMHIFQDDYNIGLYTCVISVEPYNLGFPNSNLVLTTILRSPHIYRSTGCQIFFLASGKIEVM